jgi:DNA-binding CsgD family transcriptional regulator
MFYPNNIPWSKIHEYLLEVGNERQPTTLFKRTITEINRLIPFDTAKLLFYNNDFLLTHMDAIEIPEPFVKKYTNYYEFIDPAKTQYPYGTPVLYTDWTEFRDTEFAIDFARPLNIDYSSGMVFYNSKGIPAAVICLFRSKCKAAYTDSEMSILHIIQPHLRNLFLNLENQASDLPLDIGLRVQDFRQLTKREVEIVLLLCQGYNTQGICSKLFISQETLYRHTNNIFRKLKISNRQELLALVMGNHG